MCDALDPDVELERDHLFVPLEFELPKPSKRCPQCHAKLGSVSRTFHLAGYLNGTCGITLGWPNIKRLGPHMDRHCSECQHKWCEQTSPTGFDDEED